MSGLGWMYGMPGYDRPVTDSQYTWSVSVPIEAPGEQFAKNGPPDQKQVGGDHYKKRKIQPIHYILENELPFIEGNIVKYITRWRDKGGLTDLYKARHYIEMLIDHEIKECNREAEEIARCEGKKDQ